MKTGKNGRFEIPSSSDIGGIEPRDICAYLPAMIGAVLFVV